MGNKPICLGDNAHTDALGSSYPEECVKPT